MKVQASIVLSFQAKTLTDAGAVLDDVLARAPVTERMSTCPRWSSSVRPATAR